MLLFLLIVSCVTANTMASGEVTGGDGAIQNTGGTATTTNNNDATDGNSNGDDDNNVLTGNVDFVLQSAMIPTRHAHTVTIPRQVYNAFKEGSIHNLWRRTSTSARHSHDLKISYTNDRGFFYVTCDNMYTCWDKHARTLLEVAP